MDRSEWQQEMMFNRNIVADEDTGEWAGNLAWRRIDELLDIALDIGFFRRVIDVEIGNGTT